MLIRDLVEAVEREGAAAVVMVAEAKGSAPREAGAAMLVTASGAAGTIGGGTVEHRALEAARRMLAVGAAGEDPLPDPPPGRGRRSVAEGSVLDFPLGQALDQCCGGHMRVAFAAFGAGDLQRLRAAAGKLTLWNGGPVYVEPSGDPAVYIYGAGHVGTALARALALLPFRIRWIDARLDVFPADVPSAVETVATPLPEAEVNSAPGDALHVVLTHSHALDMEIVGAVMERGDFGFLGLIGSDTKKALFLRRLRERGLPEAMLARLVCPVGVPGIRDKRPEVIAASIAAQLLKVSSEAIQVSRESA
jgi:xanthine dehydrogenase accessory factor